MSEHAWFDEHLAAYSVGGLTPSERERFERHAADCAGCGRSLKDWDGFDSSLDDLFAEVRPEAGLENRLLEGLRTAPIRRLHWTTPARVAAGIAALVMLGAIGALMQNLVENGNLPFPGLWAESPGRTQASNNLKQISLIDASDSMKANDELPPVKRAWAFGTHGTTDHGLNFSPDGHQVALGDGSVRGLDLWTGQSMEFGFKAPSRIHSATEADEIGGKVNRKDPNISKDRELKEGREADKLKWGKKLGVTASESAVKRVEQLEAFGCGTECVSADFGVKGRSFALRVDQPATFGFDVATGLKTTQAKKVYKDIADNIDRKSAESAPAKADPKTPGGTTPGTAGMMGLGNGTAYFMPADAKVITKTVNRSVPSEKPKFTVTSGKPRKEDREVAVGEKGKPPAVDNRKIVRTGDIEYEVDSFDSAVERINKLINMVQGAFVATTNSDKLPNGKVKGSVVVRIPPDSLDKFLLDLRKELGKTGELKSLRIGSQDITKQYTDVESRLRAAKTMEERLLKIIKTGKGEIKDLIAAEHELGLWRTKIEEMEGEIRYYNNQVSLSKLTIGLTEKEIQAASALEITEKIKMRIEVEEVEKAQDTVLEEVKKAKGRVIKSDLKMHGAGQLEAIMTFEVAPADVPNVRKVLRQIGNITKDEAERQQTAVGGTGPAGNVKPQVKDTHFDVHLYNLANIQPRETLTLTVATLDVPTSYKKLQEAVKGKGVVRRGQFNEQDKLNISAFFDFDLNVKDRSAIDKVLAEVGKEIGRSTDQAQPSDNVTEQKVGYRLTLRSVASIPPREIITLAIEVKNVEQTTGEMVDAVKSSKGLVATGPLFTLDPNGQVRAVILFDVPFAARDELIKQFKATGTVRKQHTAPNAKVPENELATAHIDVILSSVGPIVPSDESLGPQLRKSLFYSFKIFSISLSFVLLGILGILPPVLVLFVAYKLFRRWRKTKAAV